MLIRTRKAIPSSDITDERLLMGRRKTICILGSLLGAGLTAPLWAGKDSAKSGPAASSVRGTGELRATPLDSVARYNNYYEFAYDKTRPAELAQSLKIDPWSVAVEGLCEKPTIFGIEELDRLFPSGEYLYRLRCVEGWSAVVPWMGFPLAKLLKQVSPLSSARFVKFVAVTQPEAMPSQRENRLLQWPYFEGLRLDEAMHPLTILATGMYGRRILKQNGAPIRLVVPWKYGFKSIKAVTRIELVADAPRTAWQQAVPGEYGFYANVNPSVPHPRWSQATERPLGDSLFTPRRRTELFNGYGEEVASLYAGMDLSQNR